MEDRLAEALTKASEAEAEKIRAEAAAKVALNALESLKTKPAIIAWPEILEKAKAPPPSSSYSQQTLSFFSWRALNCFCGGEVGTFQCECVCGVGSTSNAEVLRWGGSAATRWKTKLHSAQCP